MREHLVKGRAEQEPGGVGGAGVTGPAVCLVSLCGGRRFPLLTNHPAFLGGHVTAVGAGVRESLGAGRALEGFLPGVDADVFCGVQGSELLLLTFKFDYLHTFVSKISNSCRWYNRFSNLYYMIISFQIS